MQAIVAAIIACIFAVTGTSPVLAQTQEQLEAFISKVVEEVIEAPLPPGVAEIKDVLENLPQLTQAGLLFWLDERIQNAIIEDDWDKVDRYQAFRTCLQPENRDCSRVQQLQAAGAWRGSDEPAVAGEGDDALIGGQGSDTLQGGQGSDTLQGGDNSACSEGARYNYDRCKAGGNSEAQCSYEYQLNLSRC